ncbi:MAG: VanZ family protein [Candidatus Weimeria sp.]|nr:VanZ family protein [Candidatus Weimeria sp.]
MLIDFDIFIAALFLAVLLVLLVVLKFFGKKEVPFLVFFALFYVYLMGVIKLTLFPITILTDMPSNIKESVCVIPFRDGLNRTDVENIIMFLPFGVGMPFLLRKKKLVTTAVCALLFSILIEGGQFVEAGLSHWFSTRIIDSGDVICNTLGACVGYLLLELIAAIYVKGLRISEIEKPLAFWKYVDNVMREMVAHIDKNG